MTQPDDPRRVKVIVELIDHTGRIADLNDRADLRARLDVARERITDPQIRVVIAGQLKQGKSQLLNSLLNMPVARVGDDETTALVTIVTYGEQPSARIVVAPHPGTDHPEIIEIPIDDIRNDLRRAPQARGRAGVADRGERPQPAAARAGWRSSTPRAWAVTGSRTCRRRSDCCPTPTRMLMVSDTSQEFTEPEMRFLRQAHEICPVGAVVATKTDLYPHWRQIVDANTGHLRTCRPCAADDSGVVAAAQPRGAAGRPGTQRGVELPGDRPVPLREGAVPRERPGTRTGYRRNRFCR